MYGWFGLVWLGLVLVSTIVQHTAPWVLAKKNPERCSTVIATALSLTKVRYGRVCTWCSCYLVWFFANVLVVFPV